ncbi:MAG TPA: adenylate/guanylate cyclase domain-containing protein [Gaiellaceae bacterium]|nr:adenylate/guanylate cyclase domain-containing protein [Gaiellaceae bacterium]
MSSCAACGVALPPAARFCPACGAPVDETRPTEERKLVTILFADLVGSTAYASEEDPERVRSFLDSFYRAMAEEAEAAGGTVEKFAGDAVLAAFGAWAAHEDHPERALHAALAMRRRFREIFDARHAIRIGVNTGEVAVGPARVGGAFISGDAVNVAARLEQAAPPGEILAAERTVAAVKGAFEFSEPEVIAAKGKEDGVPCRRLVSALSMQRSRGVSGLAVAFVGRQTELDLLSAVFRRALAQREPHLVTIVGEPGVGKTRLVREFWEVLADEEPTHLRRVGRCLPYGDGITYWPLGEILREHYGILDSDAPEEVARRLEGREVLALALGLDVARGLHPLDARERLHATVVELVEELAARGSAVLLVEDIHWAEDDLLDLLERVVREAQAPVVVLTTARPELLDRRPHWSGGRRNATTIWLEPLPSAETARLVDELLAVEVPEPLRDLLVERAEGNPFFLEELLGELVDTGVLERQNGAWSVGELPADFSIPDSVHAVLAARLDRLPPREKAGLQAASVVGRTFRAGPVAHLLDGEEPDLVLLERRDFIRRLPGSSSVELEYTMKHALTRDVAYASIPKARRGRLHAALAQWLEEGEGTSDEHASLLAYHYSEAVKLEDADLVWAGEPDELARVRRRAVHWLSRAGRLARGRHEMEEAVELYTRAVDLSDDEHEQALLWRAIGEAHALRYDGEGMRRALLRALEGPLDDVERADAYAFLAFQSSIRSAMWSIKLNMDLIDEWASRALELAADGTEARARALLARANIEPTGASEDVLVEASALADALDSVDLRSFALGARAQSAFDQRRFQEAAAWSEQRLALLTVIDDPDHRCEAYEAGSPAAAAVCRFGEARRLAELHGMLAQRLSAHHRVHSVSLELELADALGDWPELAAQTDRALAAIEANLATPCVRNPRDLLLCSLAHLCLGDDARAEELERDGLRLAGEGYETYLSGARLRIALQRDDRRSIESLVELPVERALVWGPGIFAARLDAFLALGRHERIEVEAPELAQAGTTVEPFALRALGAARNDDELLARADERFAALGLEWHRAQTERLLGGL